MFIFRFSSRLWIRLAKIAIAVNSLYKNFQSSFWTIMKLSCRSFSRSTVELKRIVFLCSRNLTWTPGKRAPLVERDYYRYQRFVLAVNFAFSNILWKCVSSFSLTVFIRLYTATYKVFFHHFLRMIIKVIFFISLRYRKQQMTFILSLAMFFQTNSFFKHSILLSITCTSVRGRIMMNRTQL